MAFQRLKTLVQNDSCDQIEAADTLPIEGHERLSGTARSTKPQLSGTLRTCMQGAHAHPLRSHNQIDSTGQYRICGGNLLDQHERGSREFRSAIIPGHDGGKITILESGYIYGRMLQRAVGRQQRFEIYPCQNTGSCGAAFLSPSARVAERPSFRLRRSAARQY